MLKNQVIIIGAGIAGMATAIRLAAKGWKVSVFETNAYPGGKLTEIRQANYRFDAGPSLFTMPQFIEDLFKVTGKDITAYFNYERLPILCQYFYEDGTQLTAYDDMNRLAIEIANKTQDGPQALQAYFAKSAQIYDLTKNVFLNKSLHKLDTYLSSETLAAFLQLWKIHPLQKLHDLHTQFFKDPKLVQFFDRYATYNGSNPFQAPATLAIIPHLEHGIGAFFPKGGMHQITQALFQLAKDLGVSFEMQKRVERIAIKNKRAIGVWANKEFHAAEVVVSNMDVYPTYHHLLPEVKKPQRILNQERSSSALIFYWGIEQRFERLDLHNIFFSKNYKKEFDCLFKTHTITDDPTVYINITAKYQPSDAPLNCENWFTMINVPSNRGQDWERLIKKARQNILQKVSRMLKTDIEPLIVTEAILDPRSIEAKTSSYQGSLYGTSSNNLMAAFLRHPNFSKNIEGLYFCGGSVHPGGGIPLCLLSAEIVSDLIN